MFARLAIVGTAAFFVALFSASDLHGQDLGGVSSPPPPLTHDTFDGVPPRSSSYGAPPPSAQPPDSGPSNPYQSGPPNPYQDPFASPPGAPGPAPGYRPPPPGYGPPVYPAPPGYGPPPMAFFPTLSADPARFWLRSEYLLWWTKNAPAPPLVTVGNSNDSTPGALGQPGTSIIYGDGSNDLGATSGWRLDLGGYFDAHQTFGVQTVFVILSRQQSGFDAFSDDNGAPVIARPAINANNGTETSYLDSLPGSMAGGVSILNRSQFLSWEINGLGKIMQSDHFRLEGLFGFRYMNLTESLEIDDQLLPLQSNFLTFLGQPVDTSSTMFDFDKFKTTNNFYGGQAGAKLTWSIGPWSIEGITKLALGVTQEKTSISGGTTVVDGSGNVSNATGGVLATTANIGSYHQTRFSLVPEEDLNLNFAITPYLTARFGYSFIYWSNVIRPGDQITRVTSPTLVPSDPSYGTGGPNQPTNHFQTTGYWAQGINIGLDFHF